MKTYTRTQVGDGVPFPAYADGSRYGSPQQAVALPDGRTGRVAFITWVGADGYVNRGNKNAGRTGTHWEATISLADGAARLPLADLTPIGADEVAA